MPYLGSAEYDFVKESNRIEAIHREPTDAEMEEFDRFLHLDKITIKDLKKFVSIYAPDHVLRDKKSLNVRIGAKRIPMINSKGKVEFAIWGGTLAPFGGKDIPLKLQSILDAMEQEGTYKTHVAFELLHPFTDGNGRSGRAIWAWQMYKKNGCLPDIGFLHSYYYQSLAKESKNNV